MLNKKMLMVLFTALMVVFMAACGNNEAKDNEAGSDDGKKG